MSKKSVSMSYGVVAILDALGTKGIWKTKDVDSVLKRWETFIAVAEREISKIASEKKVDSSLHAFSDTIILTFKNNSIENLLDVASRILRIALTIGVFYGIPLRGAISIGDFSSSSKMILGPAIDEASEYYETDNWIGVSVTPGVYSFLTRKNEKQNSDILFDFVQYGIPKKNNVVNGWAILLDYDMDLSEFKTINAFPGCKNLLDVVHLNLEKSKDPSGAQKWKNTMDFIYYLKSKKNKIL